MEIPEHENRRLQTIARAEGVPLETIPFRTAALVGCAVAVQREYFFRIGGFDEGMAVWGGENIELAMRNWLCGGQVRGLNVLTRNDPSCLLQIAL